MFNAIGTDHLIILEMANNHMGNVEHGKKIIKEFQRVASEFPYKFAFKFQYRNLETFIHPDYKDRLDIKYIKRFSETKLTQEQFLELKKEAEDCGFMTLCTPFDEDSVKNVVNHGYNFIKIASCSLTDWPLLEEIARQDKPIIASTAGVTYGDIDRVVSFFENRKKDFCLMHCVGEYPTSDQNHQLNQIDELQKRYKNIEIGFSTHEDPNNTQIVGIVTGKGVRIFEKHVGVPTQEYAINGYSATPEQLRTWLNALKASLTYCGEKNAPERALTEEAVTTLRSLRRGAFAKKRIEEGEVVKLESTFLAIPCIDNQVQANDYSKYTDFVATRTIEANEAIILGQNALQVDKREKVFQIMNQVKAIIDESGVTVPKKIDIEISHHFGIDNFDKVGCTILNYINREYCKKLIVSLPGQLHPEQYHEKKEEAFHILHGVVEMKLDGQMRELHPGEIVVVERGVRHEFISKTGAIIEEISSTHYRDDSYYTDPSIALNKNRKTHINYWLTKA